MKRRAAAGGGTCHDRGGVDAAAEERADGDVGDKMRRHRFVELARDRGFPISFGDARVRREMKLPVPPGFTAQLTEAARKQMRRGKALDTAENGFRSRHEAECQVRFKRLGI